ncbi:MAG: helicase-related protein [Pseudomonadota bacterium]
MLLTQASSEQGVVTAVLGPTNTGKTHYAIERMLSRPDGVIGLPLRLLAREVYDKIVRLRGAHCVALITGEEKILPAQARYHVCTVEAMPLDNGCDFVAIDEIQLCADPDRGHVFTDRLLRARGRYETLFMGSDTMRGRIGHLVPQARFLQRERFSTLTYSGSKKIGRLKPRTAIVAFSVEQVYAIAELIRRQRGGAAVVMGALSPRTRNAQVALYQNGDVDYLVATDAIGMGLNLDIDHIAFAGLTKFDGRRHRHLAPNELAQIAGRAGRYTQDGTFGTTGEAPPLDDGVVTAIENHRFRPIEKLMWRNHTLDYGSVPGLIESLEAPSDHQDLARAREADDLAALRLLWADPEIRALADRPDRVRLLWDVCQVPDFRKTIGSDHASLIAQLYRFLLSRSRVIPEEWMSGQVQRLDRTDGDIDTLSKRLAFIRTWTYVANRAKWLEDPVAWRESTRAVEDRLSDALHDRLTQRFVDRRTSVLMRRLKQKERLVAEVKDQGEVTVEGEFVGRLDGFRFTFDESATAEEIKTLRSASLGALQAELSRRADKLYLSPDSEIDVTDQGGLIWGKDIIGRLEKGDSAMAPRARAFVDDIAEQDVADKVNRRLSHWIQRRVQALFDPMLAMQADEALSGLARGIAFQIGEGFGIVARRGIADDVKALDQDGRALLRKHGVRFGQYHIFMPALLKPAPTRMRLILWSVWNAFDEFPEIPPAGHVTVPATKDAPQGYYERAGYRLCGARALRIDMLERLADLLRPMDAKAGFEAQADMLSITGCTLEQFAEIMRGLGYHSERGERAKAAKPAKPTETEAAAETMAAPNAEEVAAEGGTAAAEEAVEGAMEAAGPDDPAETNGATQPEAAVAAQDAPAQTTEAQEPMLANDAAAPPDPVPMTATEAPSPAEDAAGGDVSATAAETRNPATIADESDGSASTETAGDADTETAGDADRETAGDADRETAGDADRETAGDADRETAETQGDATSAVEAPDVEVFFTFTMRPRRSANRGNGRRRGGAPGDNANSRAGEDGGQRRSRNRGRGQNGEQREGDGGDRPTAREGRRRDGAPGENRGGEGKQARSGKGPKGKHPKGKDSHRSGDQGRSHRNENRRSAHEDKPIDPDSPFAILQQLKNR